MHSWLKRSLLIGNLLFACLFFSNPGSAQIPLTEGQIPENLRPWINWVLKGHETELCPVLSSGGDTRQCTWASRLDLKLNAKGGSFSQSWKVDAESEIPLPGDDEHWPQGVTVNGQGAAVLSRDTKPVLFLKPGAYQIAGNFVWNSLPESFPIPSATGILRLEVDGQEKPFPQVDEGGVVWVRKESETAQEENRLEMRVNRKLTDDIPFIITTHLNLNVSGQNREIVLEKPLLEGFLALTLKSPLPARLENDGKLRIQVKPGNWRIEIEARHQGPVNALSLGEHAEPWPSEEIWVFEAVPDLRLVWVEGVPSIDPQQTTLPDEWKQLPAYRMTATDTMTLKEKRRGDSDPAPDQLQLNRDWWLDFNGDGYTLRDTITGTFHRSWRIEMNAPVQLGRIAVDGQNQFITQLPGEKKWGVEIRQGRANVDADSRINGALRKVPALGWDQNFQQVSGTLHLPPGWRAFNITGVDDVPDTWIQRWTLLDFFLVLITALAIFKLWGWRWGLLALVTLALIFPERDAPQWLWLAAVAGFALLRVLPPGKLWKLVRIYKAVVVLVLIAISLPFMVQQIRVGLFPALEHRWQSISNEGPSAGNDGRAGGGYYPGTRGAPMAPPAPAQVAADEPDAAQEQTARPQGIGYADKAGKTERSSSVPTDILRSKKKSYAEPDAKQQLNLQQQRPGTKVQTGPGLPRWNWNQIRLIWNGPVEKTQELCFWLLSPTVNLILALIRVILIAALLLCMLGLGPRFLPWMRGAKFSTLALALVLGTSVFYAPNARADFPSQEILDQLRERLLEDPICHPDCAGLTRGQLTVTAQSLQFRLEAVAQATSAVPLPGTVKEWTPEQVLLDGQTASGLFRNDDGSLWLLLTPGVHQIVLEGRLPDRDTVPISFPQKPNFLTTQVSGWTVEGVDENGLVEDNLQLTRLPENAISAETQGGGASQIALTPFVRVEREIVLGLTWEVVTRVVRVTPTGVPVVLEVPLIPGESVITPDIKVTENKVLVNMSPNASDLEWRSVLAETPKIELKATEAPNWMETWRLNAAPIWHVVFTGIPFMHSGSTASSWLPEWRPWPGETLNIAITRPEGVPGQTLTIDASTMKVTPGLRFTEIVLNLTLRSSLGAQHVITLPPNSDLQSVAINGQTQPIRADQGKLTLPIVPGEQGVEIKFQLNSGIRSFFRAPPIDLGAPSVNAEVQFNLPANRWMLYTGGPRMGPAVLFWSLLAIILLFSVGLSRTRLTPLKTLSWFLLGIGISQFPEQPVLAALFVAGWFLLLGWRQRSPELGPWSFNLRQIFLALYTIAALVVLFSAIYQGLLGIPQMQIAGNGSEAGFLRWYQDRSGNLLPQPWVISLPVFYYRLAIFAWALWIAVALINWLRWAWTSFATGHLWKPLGILRKKA